MCLLSPAFYKQFIRPTLFRQDPEQAHLAIHKSIAMCRPLWPMFGKNFVYTESDLSCELFGQKLSNPVGLAAGFDKNGDLTEFLNYLGFGFAEIGSVTALSSEGNQIPRLFRLESDNAIINRMGLNGEGADAIAAKLEHAKFGLPLGLNIAKTNAPNITGDAAVKDILYTFNKIKSLPLTYVTINASCPNTKEGIVTEASHMRTVFTEVAKLNSGRLPILVKLSPDSSPDLVGEMVEAASACGLSGFVCGNTSTGRDNLSTDSATVAAIGLGGLSGRPLKNKALQLCQRVHSLKKRGQIIIGCGGISSGQDAYDFIAAGASFLQIYTGLVYEGPGLPLVINEQLAEILQQNGLSLTEAIGAGHQIPT